MFSVQALDFLFEIASRDDREWYHAHKDEYKHLVVEPMTGLTEALRPVMLEIDPQMDISPKRISRIYRDARMLNAGNRTFFRDHVWVTFGQTNSLYWGPPSYFFELNPNGFRMGMGYYVPARKTLETMREMILKEDPTFLKALSAYESQSDLDLAGECYKRNHYPDQPEAYCNWLNRKELYLVHDSGNLDLLFSDSLPGWIGECFRKVAPVYDFWMKTEIIWRGQQD